MRRLIAFTVLFCAACLGQRSAPIPDSQVPQRKEIFRNRRVMARLLELAPGEATPMHQHARDMLAVFVNGGKTSNTIYGSKPTNDRMAAGVVRFKNPGYPDPARDEGRRPV